MAKDIADAIIAIAKQQEQAALQRSLFKLTVSVSDITHTVGDHDDVTQRELSGSRRTWLAARAPDGGVLLSLGAGEGRDGAPRLMVSVDAGSAGAIRWYLESELEDLVRRADGTLGRACSASDLPVTAAEASMAAFMELERRLGEGTGDEGAAGPCAPGGVREMAMKLEHISAEAAAAARAPPAPRDGGGCERDAGARTAAAAGPVAAFQEIMSRRVVLGGSSQQQGGKRSSGCLADSDRQVQAALDQALHFVTAALGIVAGWRPAVQLSPAAAALAAVAGAGSAAAWVAP